jgi:hypothetical protein
MTMTPIRTTTVAALLLALAACAATAAAQDAAKMDLADGKLQLTAPEGWVRKQPATRIVEHEFSIPATEGDAADGRLTVMGAGGGVQANIDRWYGQFTQADGGNTRERAKVKQLKAGGKDVHLVDISGTFRDQRGPMSPVVERPKYRMLAAVIETGGQGDYFIKFYGPEKTVAANEKAFVKMIEGLEQK